MSQEKSKSFHAWQQEFKESITKIDQLLYITKNTYSEQSSTDAIKFGLRVPQGFARRIRKNNPKDPLLLQVIPRTQELITNAKFSSDPLRESFAMRSPGFLKKYDGRVLLLTTGTCAIHCRYCFRRTMPYSENNPRKDHWQAALQELERDTTIEEVILSGGDPLSLTDEELTNLCEKLSAITHVKRLRIHTRFPIVIPSRVNADLLCWLRACKLKKIIVLHINHSNEIDYEVSDAIQKLRQCGCILFNQSVLLKDINDDVDALINLSKSLIELGIVPYYLHMLDPVEGTSHFNVPEKRAKELIRSVANALPGYMVPKLVREIPGEQAKTLL